MDRRGSAGHSMARPGEGEARPKARRAGALHGGAGRGEAGTEAGRGVERQGKAHVRLAAARHREASTTPRQGEATLGSAGLG